MGDLLEACSDLEFLKADLGKLYFLARTILDASTSEPQNVSGQTKAYLFYNSRGDIMNASAILLDEIIAIENRLTNITKAIETIGKDELSEAPAAILRPENKDMRSAARPG